MCIEKTKPKHDKRQYVEPPQDPTIVIYYKEFGKDDPKIFRVSEFEEAIVVCPRGEINLIDVAGFYKIISIPAKVMWVRISKLVLTVGVPRGVLPGGFGIHADVILTIHNVESLLRNIIKVSREGIVNIDMIKKELRRILENAARNLQIDPNMPRRELVEEIHKEMNSLLMRSWLNGFVCDVQSVGFSFECELSKIFEGESE